jgi:DNA invertase Pin-like site-specific DNA recombinase
MTHVAYYRVSTQRQGQSGLGLEAQQEAVRRLIGGPPELEFTEIESGRKTDRPQLAAAIAKAKDAGAVLIVAKLDRLARDVRMILSIVDSGVRVRFVDLPDIDTATATGRLILTVMASLAEFEAKRISERTKDALQAKKARGEKLGSPDPAKGSRATAYKAHLATQQAAQIVAQFADLTLREVCQKLEERAILSPGGGQSWHPATVRRVRRRIDAFSGV